MSLHQLSNFTKGVLLHKLVSWDTLQIPDDGIVTDNPTGTRCATSPFNQLHLWFQQCQTDLLAGFCELLLAQLSPTVGVK